MRTAESESEKEDLLKKLRDKTGITYQSLERDLQNLPAESRQTEMHLPPPSEAGTDKYKKAARFILAAKLVFRAVREKLRAGEYRIRR